MRGVCAFFVAATPLALWPQATIVDADADDLSAESSSVLRSSGRCRTWPSRVLLYASQSNSISSLRFDPRVAFLRG